MVNNIFVAIVACGDRLPEALNVIKSAIMFTKSVLNFIVVTEENLILNFEEKVIIDFQRFRIIKLIF